jgi:hypothetical protein
MSAVTAKQGQLHVREKEIVVQTASVVQGKLK